ncbi:FAD-dependent oxidoreductase [Amycolatopsis regifaucium]|uniref:FAD-binding monooxygenase n=1 Tax=Amycolatopsis regifaucium TaxID=546365 RepID=A0A154MND4_9PSEU|nr:NAD(P)/FAD-dependent oxidoreductase [Amycolatopsis regifaucium]KZB85483.1 FAD-binding monooxygenase [Amycolatopsis regifaucium]OKA03564.1 FAD-binding monooxygenase [Amycolatopsis regifaucium]SFJ50331.1 2-polyprenyl-6-methoxyphenol hydroxylase [Amycolatopsis regifaucium]
MTTRIAIIGGGTGGLCLAQGLRKAGVDVSVYERSRTRAERLQGYRVHINPQGSAALHECLPSELWTRLLATTGTSSGPFSFVTEQLKDLMVIDNELTPSPDPASNHHSVSRISLHQVLSDGLEEVLQYGKEFVGYRRKGEAVVCEFADGSTAEADLVIGADGANSRVRKQFLPHADRVDTGIIAIAGKYPLNQETRERLPARLTGGPSMVMPRTGAGLFSVPHELNGASSVNDETAEYDPVLFDNTSSYIMWAFAADNRRYPDNLSSLDGAALRALMLDLVDGWAPAFKELVAGSPSGSVSRLPIFTSKPVEPWPTSNITLLGDAIHSMTPFRGIGANTALRDARMLCRNLVAAQKTGAVPAAVADYEQQMRDYGFAAVRDSERSARQFVSENRAGRTMARGMFRFFQAVPPLKRKVFSDHGDS